MWQIEVKNKMKLWHLIVKQMNNSLMNEMSTAKIQIVTDLRQKWKARIFRKNSLRSSAHINDYYFSECEIIRESVTYDESWRIIYHASMQRPRLQKTVVPILFEKNHAKASIDL